MDHPKERTSPVPIMMQMNESMVIFHSTIKTWEGEGENPEVFENEKVRTFFQSLIWQLTVQGQSFEATLENNRHLESYRIVLNLPFLRFMR